MILKSLWSKKDLPTDVEISNFTIGDDRQIDPIFLPFDCLGTSAHVRQLHQLGHLTRGELDTVLTSLKGIFDLSTTNVINLEGYEDGHSYLEFQLTEKLGDVGKKIHLGRSRNDQVLVTERLWMRHEILELHHDLLKLCQQLCSMSDRYKSILMPGYTHQRKAMPTTFGFWIASYAEAFTEILSAGKDLYHQLNFSPLGAAAGFGSPVPLDRILVSRLLGFDGIQRNALNIISSRGRYQLDCLHWINQITNIFEKFFIDLSIFSQEEYQFISLPNSFTTGSSIMPQKRNPDVLELARGRCSEIRGLRTTLENISASLPSSYHRDSQLQKFYLVRSFLLIQAIVNITPTLTDNLQVHEDKMKSACTPDLFSTHEVYQLVLKGLPFREAYKIIGEQILAGSFKAQLVESYLPSLHSDFEEEGRLRNNQIDVLDVWGKETKGNLKKLFAKLMESA